MRDSKPEVRDVVVRAVLAPMRLPLRTSSGAITEAPLVLIDLETTTGITGRAYLFAFTRGNLAPLASVVRGMAELIHGDALAPFEIEKKLRQRNTLLGVHNLVLMALSGIDMAAWDAHAQHLDAPLACVLGGMLRPVRAYNSKGLGIMPAVDAAREARALVAEGFSAVKLRLGRASAQADIEVLRAVKDAIGPDVTLMCDFNQALTVNQAILRGRMLDREGGLAWIEEPTRADDLLGHARIAQALETPVQIGENFMGPEQMAQALAVSASDYVMPDAQRIGGVTGWMRAAALAQGAGLEMSSHLFPEVSAHLLAVTPTCHWLEYVDWAAPILEEPLLIEDSHVVCPSTAGSGIRWDEANVTKFAA
ncbi:MAG: mandelate racemase [Pseudomonadota bacterium]|nr:mandelate racemase [Pseudomonadota bacterium]